MSRHGDAERSKEIKGEKKETKRKGNHKVSYFNVEECSIRIVRRRIPPHPQFAIATQ